MTLQSFKIYEFENSTQSKIECNYPKHVMCINLNKYTHQKYEEGKEVKTYLTPKALHL